MTNKKREAATALLAGLIALCAMLYSSMATAVYQPGFDITATRCRFTAQKSFWLAYPYPTVTAPFNAESILIQWEPRNGAVSNYQWFYDTTSFPYSTLMTSPPRAPTLAQNTATSGRWEFFAWVNSSLSATSSLPNRVMTAQVFPSGSVTQGGWIFAGILQETGSGTITAVGTLECEH